MVKLSLFSSVALLSLSAIAAAQAPATEAAPPAAGTPACALPAVADSVALKDVPGSGLVTVPVAINGKPEQFLLRVGPGASEVSRATVDELKLIEGVKRTETFQAGPTSQTEMVSNRDPTVGAAIQSTIVDMKGANAAEESRPHVTIPSFTIGDATGKNLTFVVADDNEIAKSAPYAGIMTGSFFKQYDVELDFVAGKLNYLTPNTCTDPHQVVFWPHKEVAIIPMDMASGKIEVQVDIAGHKINAVLDTSAPRSIMRYDVAENTLDLKAGSAKMPPVEGLRDGEDMQIYTATFSEITFAGGVTAYNVPALIQVNGMTPNLHKETMLFSRAQFKNVARIPQLTLGMDVLRQLHLYIVYGQNSIYMTAAE